MSTSSSASSSYSQRFRDIAALFDLTEGESEVTATTSLANKMNAKSNAVSFLDKLQQQFQQQQQQQPFLQPEESQDQQEENPLQQEPYRKASKKLYSFLEPQEHLPFGDNNLDLDGENSNDGEEINFHSHSPHESYITERQGDNCNQYDDEYKYEYDNHSNHSSSDVVSQPYSNDLSTEAETGRHYWGTTSSVSASKRLLFREHLHNRFSKPLTTHPEIELQMQQPKELVLNTTDSTDSCSLSRTTGSASTTPQRGSGGGERKEHSDEHDNRHCRMESRNLSFELTSPAPSDQQQYEHEHEHEHEHEAAIRSPEVPSWKALQRQKMQERMQFLASPTLVEKCDSVDVKDTLNTPMSPQSMNKTAADIPDDSSGSPLEIAAPALITPPPPPCARREFIVADSNSNTAIQSSGLDRTSWRARHFKRTFRHRASLRRRNWASTSVSSVSTSVTTTNDDNDESSAVVSLPSPAPTIHDHQHEPFSETISPVPTVSEDEDDECQTERHSRMQQNVPLQDDTDIPSTQPSPVKLFRNRFETAISTQQNRASEVSSTSYSSSLSSSTPIANTKVFMDASKLHQRRKNHRVLKYPSRSGFKTNASSRTVTSGAQADREEEKDNVTIEDEQVQQPADLNENDVRSKAPQSTKPQFLIPATWWTEMEEKVDRYQRTVLAQHDQAVGPQALEIEHTLQQSFQTFAEDQNQLGRAMAVALFKGMIVARQHMPSEEETAAASILGGERDTEEIQVLKDSYERELQMLRDAHERERREWKEQLLAAVCTAAAVAPVNAGTKAINSVVSTNKSNNNSNTKNAATNRNEAFRQRWKNRISNNNNNNNSLYNPTALYSGDDTKSGMNGAGGGGAGTEVASTVLSNMSCRELSVERYRARILQQMNRGKTATVSATTRRPTSSKGLPNRFDTDNNAVDDSASIESSGHNNDENEGNNAEEIQRLLDELQQAERRQKLLEKQLQQAGVVLAEDIPYQLAKDKVASISKRMNEIGSSEVVHSDPSVQKQLREEYFRLEKDMQKYLSALMLTDEYAEERCRDEEAWEARHVQANEAALKAIRKHMPVDVRTLTPTQLEKERGLPKTLVQRFRRINVLQLLRVDPEIVAKWHPSALEALRVTGLTLTERRALHSYLLPVLTKWNGTQQHTFTSARSSGDSMTKRKLAWYNALRTNFKEALNKYDRHVASRPNVSSCSHGCNLVGNQCPVRANQAVEYFETDLGFPAHGLYEDPVQLVAKDDQLAQRKSAAEVIAEARKIGPEIVEGKAQKTVTMETRANSSVSKPAVVRPVDPNFPAKRKPHPMMMQKAHSAPSGLLAAIAARRID